ncbi:hypothetical protein [Devosia sp. MC521]|nr:hypothetical protein [Devosia sp. MC521]
MIHRRGLANGLALGAQAGTDLGREFTAIPALPFCPAQIGGAS